MLFAVSFILRVAAGCPCQERIATSIAYTQPVKVGMLASAGSNNVAVKSPVPKTSSDFALAEAWCFCNLPVVRATTGDGRGLW